ncbi:MAG: tetratricopeptide repeat protein [Pseudomonadota bacterium]
MMQSAYKGNLIEAAYQQGVSFHKAGQEEEAAKLYCAVIQKNPDHFGARFNLARIKQKQNKIFEAIEIVQSLNEENKLNSSIGLFFGNLLMQSHEYEKADHVFKSVLLKDENRSLIVNGIVQSMLAQGQNAKAYEWLVNELKLEKNNEYGWFLLANLESVQKNSIQSIFSIHKAIAINSKNFKYQLFLAELLSDSEQYSDALKTVEEIEKKNFKNIKLQDFERLQYIKARSYFFQSDLIRAENEIRAAIHMNQDNHRLWCLLGDILGESGHFQEAIESYKKVLVLKPDVPEAQFSLAMCQLSLGEWKRGFELYSWRWSIPQFQKDLIDFPLPVWNGIFQPGMKLLVWQEQGVGDIVQFLRPIMVMQNKKMDITFLCDERLIPIVKRSFPSIKVIAKNSIPDLKKQIAQKDFDAQIPLGDLMYYCWEFIDWNSSYLKAPLINSTIFSQNKKINIGFSWATMGKQKFKERTIALSEWKNIFESNENVQWTSLQYGSFENELPTISAASVQKCPIDPLIELDQLTGLMDAMDLIITIDNSTAHLAGALGKTTWLLLPDNPDWRWPRQSLIPQWYSSVRIFHQQKRPWSEVLIEVQEQLRLALEHGASFYWPDVPKI